MSKTQSILGLILFLMLLFSMDMIFGNHLRETFSNQIGLPGNKNVGINGVGVGTNLDYKPLVRTNTLNGNMIYSGNGGNGYFGETSHYPKGDDEPLFFGFSF